MTNYISENEIKRDRLYDYMVECEIATPEELGVASCIGGYTLDTMETVLFYKTGYRSLEQICEDDE